MILSWYYVAIYTSFVASSFIPPSHRRRGATTVFGENRHHRSDTASTFFYSFSPTRHTCLPQYNRHGIAVGSPVYIFAIARRLYCGVTAVMEVLPRGHDGDGGATAVLVRCHGGHGGAAATPLRIGPTRDDTTEVLNMLKVSAVPPRRSAVLTVFGGATAINDGITAEPRRSRRCHCGLCRTSTAVHGTASSI